MAIDTTRFQHVTYGWDRNYEYRNLYNYNLYGDPAMEWRGAGERRGRAATTAATRAAPRTGTAMRPWATANG